MKNTFAENITKAATKADNSSELSLSSLNTIISQLPGMICLKSPDSIYTTGTHTTANLLGFKDPDDLSGHSDYELRCPAAEGAEEFRALDKKLMATKEPISSLQIHGYADGNIHILRVTKTPIFNSQKTVIAITCVLDEISNPVLGQALFNLIQLDKPYNNNSNQMTYQISQNYNESQLTPRENELIFFLLRGFTIKQIALLMQLSPRTVESYVDTIKAKFNCKTKNDLIVHCLQNGYSNIIPENILQRSINKIILL